MTYWTVTGGREGEREKREEREGGREKEKESKQGKYIYTSNEKIKKM